MNFFVFYVRSKLYWTREKSNYGYTRKDELIYSSNWRLDAILWKNKPDLISNDISEETRKKIILLSSCDAGAYSLLKNPVQRNYRKNPTINPVRANFTKWSNTLKQFVGNLPTNCLSVFDHFVGLALKGLINESYEWTSESKQYLLKWGTS